MKTTHNDNHVCFSCRYTSKGGSKCPFCRQPLMLINYRWRLPKRSDIRGWKKTLETMRNYNQYHKQLLEGIEIK